MTTEELIQSLIERLKKQVHLNIEETKEDAEEYAGNAVEFQKSYEEHLLYVRGAAGFLARWLYTAMGDDESCELSKQIQDQLNNEWIPQFRAIFFDFYGIPQDAIIE